MWVVEERMEGRGRGFDLENGVTTLPPGGVVGLTNADADSNHKESQRYWYPKVILRVKDDRVVGL
jgi:hypothetical protein